MRRLAVALAVLAAVAVLAPRSVLAGTSPSLPSCPEDAVLIGHGQYAAGHWSKYSCVALDDVSPLQVNRAAPSLVVHAYVKVSPRLVLDTPAVRYANVIDRAEP